MADTAMIEPRFFRRGDIVRYHASSGHHLACGSGLYPFAIVIKTAPLVLASWEGDMRWESTVAPEHLVLVNRAPWWVTLRLWLRRRKQ